MSASREKKLRKDSLASGLTEKELRQKRDEQKANNKVRLYTGILAAVVLVFLALILWNSNLIQKHATAVVIGNERFTAADVDYYYNTAYNQIRSNYGNYFSYIVDTSKSLKRQAYSDTQSWHDYILEQALKNMRQTIVLSKAAEKENFTLTQASQDDIANIKAQIDQVCAQYAITRETYFKSFGDTMTEAIFNKHLNLSHLADDYLAELKSKMVYSDAELDAYYQQNPNNVDKVNYRYFFISGTAAEGGDEAKSMAAALATATEMADRVKDGEDFTALAQAYAPEDKKDSYADASATTAAGYAYSSVSSYVSADVANWLYDAARAAGDSTMIKTDTGYYVLLFQDRYRDDYNTVNVRHILIQPEVSEGATEATDEQKAAAKAKAEALLAEWKAGAATEDSFAALATENSSDTGSKENGGLYTQVYKGQMVTAFNDWCFDSARRTGDTGVVETDYGYHVIYFVGQDLPYWKIQVKNTMMSEAYNTWFETASADYVVSNPKFGMQFVG